MKKMEGNSENRAGMVFWRRGLFALLCLILLTCLLIGYLKWQDRRTVVTILYSSDFQNLEKLVEDTFPDIDLQFERMSHPGQYLRRLEKDAGSDLVILPQPSEETSQKYLLDIGDMQASRAYDGTVMQQTQVDGITYLLPLPGQYSGYILNETLLREAGLSVPTTNGELLEALVSMKEQGIGVGEDGINFSISSEHNIGIGMYYTGYMVPDFLGTMEGVGWLAGFKDKENTFTGAWEGVLDLTEQMAAAGVMEPAAIGAQKNTIRHQERMADGSLAAMFGVSSNYQDCVERNRVNVREGTAPEYTYRMLPLLSDEGNEPWMILAPTAYIGVNAAADEKKREAAKRILELLSTPEGQEAVVEDLQAGVSYLRDYRAKESLVPKGLEEYAEKGYVYNVRFPDRVVEYLGSQVRQVLGGKMTLQEALEAVDRYYYEGSEAADYDLSVVGTVGQDLLFYDNNVRVGETELGNLVADSVAEAAKTPIAAVNGGGIRSSLYKGEVYGEDLSAVCPYDNVIVVLEMDGRTLWNMLENGLSMVTEEFPGGRFLQVSGIRYTFDSRKPVGRRMVEVKLADGTAVEKDKTYRVAVNDYMAGSQGYAEGNGDGYKMLNVYDDRSPKGKARLVKETDMTYRDALTRYFDSRWEEPVKMELDGRIIDLAGEK